ncbi:homeobox and leucine zipper protein Homez [Arapaima gigas]
MRTEHLQPQEQSSVKWRRSEQVLAMSSVRHAHVSADLTGPARPEEKGEQEKSRKAPGGRPRNHNNWTVSCCCDRGRTRVTRRTEHRLERSGAEQGMTTQMAARDRDRTAAEMERQPFRAGAVREMDGKKGSHQNKNGKTEHAAVDSDGSEGGGAVVSFSTNHNSVVCLPLVSEGLKLVWTQSDQTRELDGIPELVQAFNVFPYPTSQEVAFLARRCALPLDKVKVWFMVQRIKYGISWASEEIEETRCKLAGPERGGLAEEDEGEGHQEELGENGSTQLGTEMKDDGSTEELEPICLPSPHKRTKREPEDAVKPPGLPHFRSSLPPPQDSYYYRSPVDAPAVALGSPDSSPGSQRRHGRYKKSKAQLAVLRSSFLRENWPAEAELRRLQEETGLSRNDIRKWFSDSRYQLRTGRAGPGMVQTFAPAQVADEDAQQLQPLPLVAHGPRHQPAGTRGGARGKGSRSSRVRDSRFFQNFLSTSLEAVGEMGVVTGVEADEEEDVATQGTVEHLVEEEESEEEQPLDLIHGRRVLETHQLLQAAPSSPSPSPASTAAASPATAALPHKRSSTGTSSQKTSRSIKLSPSPTSHPPSTTSSSSSSSSSSPVLTAAGRPRKTKEQLDVLKQHFLRCQWPKSEDYTRLVELTGLPRADVIQWFGDTRYAVKNGQLRWVRGVRDQFMADLALQQNGGGANGTSRGGGRRRKLEENGGRATPPNGSSDSHEVSGAGISGVDLRPLEVYRRNTGALQEKDLDALCRKSRMSYQQVRDWFACQEGGMSDSEVNVTD